MIALSPTGDADYLDLLDKIGIKRSMSRTSNPWDNALIESCFSTLHFKLLSRTRRSETPLPINYDLPCQMRKRRT